MEGLGMQFHEIPGIMGSKTLPSACYILSEDISLPFYSTSNG